MYKNRHPFLTNQSSIETFDFNEHCSQSNCTCRFSNPAPFSLSATCLYFLLCYVLLLLRGVSTKLEGIHRLFSLSVLTSFLSQCAMYAVLVFGVALMWLASDVGTWRYWFGLLRDQLLGFLFGYRPLLVVIDYRGSNGNYDDSVLLVGTVFLCVLSGAHQKNWWFMWTTW